VREMKSFNDALLMRQGWKIHNKVDAMISKVYQAKYLIAFPIEAIDQHANPRSMSSRRRGLHGASKQLRESFRWSIRKYLVCGFLIGFEDGVHGFKVQTLQKIGLLGLLGIYYN